MSSLKTFLKRIQDEIRENKKTRENAQESMRKTTSLSKQAILLIHQKKTERAEERVEEARQKLAELNKIAEAYPEVIYGGMFDAARQEFSEAYIFLKLIAEGRFPSPQEVGAPSIDYVLGLADVIGECRRVALDALRQGDAEKGEKFLHLMDEIYVELSALDDAYMLIHGLRRKCDVARRIIEATRGDVTQEIRRKALEDSMSHLEKSLKKRRKH